MFFNKYFNASNDEEVVISNEVHQQEDVVADVVTVKEEEVVADAADAAAQPKQQPHKYDAQFYFDEARYEKAYALAQSAIGTPAEEKALAEEMETMEAMEAMEAIVVMIKVAKFTKNIII